MSTPALQVVSAGSTPRMLQHVTHTLILLVAPLFGVRNFELQFHAGTPKRNRLLYPPQCYMIVIYIHNAAS
jgi:hypothetical protein